MRIAEEVAEQMFSEAQNQVLHRNKLTSESGPIYR